MSIEYFCTVDAHLVVYFRLASFPSETELWDEVQSLTASLQSSLSDEKTQYMKTLFNSLPASLQCHLLQRIVENTADVLEQCRLTLLMLNKYPNKGPEQGVNVYYLKVGHIYSRDLRYASLPHCWHHI